MANERSGSEQAGKRGRTLDEGHLEYLRPVAASLWAIRRHLRRGREGILEALGFYGSLYRPGGRIGRVRSIKILRRFFRRKAPCAVKGLG